MAARALQAQGFAPTVLEACLSPGGLTRSMHVGEFCFDYTGHLLHLSRYATPAALPYAGLRDDDWRRIERRSACFVGGRMITAPLQYHAGELAAGDRLACLAAYDARPALPVGDAATFRDYIVCGFGQYLADVFLIPQNEKTMATSLDRLSLQGVKRFFPAPDDGRVRAGFAVEHARAPARPDAASGEYNSQFWYPRVGGIGRLADGLARGLTDVQLHAAAVEIDLGARSLLTADGRRWRWDRMLASVPLRRLCELTTDPELRAWASALTHSTTISFNLGLRARLPGALRGIHWIYVPDRELPFYRVGVYSNMSEGICPENCTALYVEVGTQPGRVNATGIANLQQRVIDTLARLGWIDRRAIACCVTHVIPCAYIHHTPEREAVIGRIHARLSEHGIVGIGRYGLWDYTSMEDSMLSALSAVSALAR